VADNIRIEDVPPMTVVSLGLQGGYDFDSYQQGLTRLKEWLAEHPSYRAISSPRRFFYDGPYVPDPLKRSEIQIPVEAVSSNR
jgi:DNA gyrase inhibitor GyrI